MQGTQVDEQGGEREPRLAESGVSGDNENGARQVVGMADGKDTSRVDDDRQENQQNEQRGVSGEDEGCFGLLQGTQFDDKRAVGQSRPA